MMPPIPDFLIATVENTREARLAWKPTRQRTKKVKRQQFYLPKSIEPAGLAMLKQMEADKAAKAKAKKKLRRK